MQPISSNYISTPPSSAVQVNRGNPIARGLQRAWFASTGIDHVSGIPAVNSSTTHNVPGQNQYGQTLRCSGAQEAQSYTVPHITAMDGGSEFTVFTVSTTNSGAHPLAGVWGGLPSTRQFFLAIDSTRSPLIAVTNGAVNRIYTANVATVPAGERVTVAGGWNSSGDTCRIWLNGSPVTGAKDGSTVSAMSTVSNPLSIAAQGVGGTSVLSGDIELVLIFNRLLSDAEIRSLTINPYQVLKPPRRALWLDVDVDVVAGGGINTSQLVSPTGTASTTTDGTASGSLLATSLSNPSGAATGGTAGSGSGSISQINIEAPTGASSGYANISSSVATATLSSPSGAASGGIGATASGSIFTTTLSAPQGSASSGASATGSGDIAQVTLTTIASSVSAWASSSGSLTAVTLSTPTGNATVDATAFGSISLVSLSTVLGSAYGAGAIVATGSIASVQLGIVNASVQSDSIVSSSISSVTLVAPTGTASTALTIVPRIIINLQAQQRYIKTKSDFRIINIKK